MLASTTARRMAGFAAAAALSLALLMPAPALADAGFRNWIASFRTTAVKAGVSGAIYDRAFRGIDAPDPEVLQKARYQPEFTAPAWDYFDNRVHDQAIANGRALARQWKPWLDRIEQRYGVDCYTLLAIWSMESNYGETLKRTDIMRSVVRSLATLGYGDPKRSKYARTQLIAALKILQTGDIDESHLSGSWAGAMGHTQFIPTSYQSYAVDMDGNGKRDIWNSVPDALATAANLLHRNGWQPGRTWGYEVSLPQGRKFPAGSMSVAKWQALGVTRANIHHHYGNKLNLCEEVIVEYVDRTLEAWTANWTGDSTLFEKVEGMMESNRKRYLQFNPTGRTAHPWSLIGRMRLESNVIGPRAREALANFASELNRLVIAGVEQAVVNGELSADAPRADIALQLVAIADSAGWITQDGGDFSRLEQLYRSVIRIVDNAYGRHGR